MRYDFDTPINRRNTFSFKWDCDMDYFGRDDVIPMWVADMDFACAGSLWTGPREAPSNSWHPAPL